jgi:hypothetical protein
MSLDPPTYLSSLQNNIRDRPIPWPGAVRAHTITEADLKKIESVNKVRKEQRMRTVEADLPGFQVLLLGGADGQKSVIESASKRLDVVQYILVLGNDLIDGEWEEEHGISQSFLGGFGMQWHMVTRLNHRRPSIDRSSSGASESIQAASSVITPVV